MGYVGQAPAAKALTSADITDDIIVNADINSSAAIASSKLATVAVAQGGTGATSLNNLITLATHSTGDYVQNITAGTNLTSTGATSGENIAHSLSVDDSFLKNDASDTTTGTVTMAHLIVGDGGNVGSASDGDAIAIAANGVVTFSQNVTLADNAVINLGEAGKIDFGDEAPADNAATGIVFSFLAGATLAIGDVVYMHTDGEVAKADADAVTSMPAIGICVGSGTDGNAVDVLVQGIMHDTSAFDTFTVGADIFVSTTAGAVTATAPSGSGDTVQKVGVALHADMVYFNFNTTEVLLA